MLITASGGWRGTLVSSKLHKMHKMPKGAKGPDALTGKRPGQREKTWNQQKGSCVIQRP